MEAENEFKRINKSSVLSMENHLGFWLAKILDLANNIILAMRMLRIISEDDSESIIEN